jgi:DDE superfamily endonuclease
MRKDVECCVGILKGRFRILKTGIRLQLFTAVDNIWFTCCALHNYLLEVDGLHKQWARGVSSDYEREMGHHDTVEIERKNLRPEIFRRLDNP